MIQKGSFLTVVDNSGARIAQCIHIYNGYRKRYAFVGDIVLVSVKSLRSQRKSTIKIKKGDTLNAVIVHTKVSIKVFPFDFIKYQSNSIVLITKQHKLIGTRIFCGISIFFRYTKFIKLLSVSSGTIL